VKQIALLIFGLIFSSTGFATTYYVSNSGNDSNSGLSWPEAFLTIQAAADMVVAGDLVLVEDGTYAGFDLRNVNGTITNPITFQADGNTVLINQSGPIRDDGINIENADWVIIDGFIVNDQTGSGNGIRLVLSDNCVVRNCSCDNNAERGIFTGFTDDILIENNVCTNSVDEHGIYVSNSSDRPIIRYNECYDNNNIGIHMNGDLSAGGDGIISDAQVHGNLLYNNNLAAGINMDGVEDPVIYNNLIYNNHSAQGIALFQQDGAIPTQGAKVYNNTIIVPSDGRWGILVTDGCNVNTDILNNIIINLHAWRGSITIENQSLFNSDYNIVNDKMSATGDGSTITFAAWQALGLGSNSFLADPLDQIFNDPANDVYSLLSTSQAVDAGTDQVNTVVTIDIDGNTRPQGASYDIGAYEFTAPLAVDLLDPVRAKVIHDQAWISWSTASEINSDYFEIMKSQDRKHWKQIEQSTAQGHSLQNNYYRIKDPNTSSGQSYYKVIETDYNGKKTVLGIAGVFVTEQAKISMFPNPSRGYLVLQHELYASDIISIELASIKGETVKSFDPKKVLLDLSDLTNGVYILSVIGVRGILLKEKVVLEN
jgi:parallel beta-helix repeat protein